MTKYIEISLNVTTTSINTYKNLFDTHFAICGTTFLRIWSRRGNVLFI